MDNSTPAEGELRRGIVARFGNYSAQMLASMKKDLGLFMNVSELERCKTQYAKGEKRDPSLDEIRFIDELVKRASSLPAFAAITDTTFNDKYCAETFSDMLQKAERVRPLSRGPLSPNDMTSISGKYLASAGIYPLLTHYRTAGSSKDCLFTLCTPDGRMSAYADMPAAVSAGRNRPFPRKSFALANNTAIVIVCPDAENGVGEDGFETALSLLTETDEFKSSVISALRIGKCGIASALASMASGLFVDMERIPGLPRPLELSFLAGLHAGAALLTMKRENTDRVIGVAASLGLCASYFAKATNSGRLVLRHENNSPMSLSTAFIRSFTNISRACRCNVPHEEYTSFSSSGGMLTNAESGALAGKDCGGHYSIGNIISGVAYSVPGTGGAFMQAVDTVLRAVLEVLSHGAHRRRITLTLKYSLSSSDMGRNLALILGAYRVMTELCLPDINSSTETAESSSASLFCAAYSDVGNMRINRNFTSVNNKIRFLSFDRDADGLPDFAGLRKACDTLKKLIDDGKVLSVAPVFGNSGDTLSMMSTDKTGFSPSADAGDAKIPSGLSGFIVETNADIEYPCIGKTVAVVSADGDLPCEVPDIPESEPARGSYIKYDTPKVAIPFFSQSGRIRAVAHTASEAGAEAEVFAVYGDPERLIRKIMTSQVVLISGCSYGESLIFENERVNEAFERILRNDAVIFVCGSAVDVIRRNHAVNSIPPDGKVSCGNIYAAENGEKIPYDLFVSAIKNFM